MKFYAVCLMTLSLALGGFLASSAFASGPLLTLARDIPGDSSADGQHFFAECTWPSKKCWLNLTTIPLDYASGPQIFRIEGDELLISQARNLDPNNVCKLEPPAMFVDKTNITKYSPGGQLFRILLGKEVRWEEPHYSVTSTNQCSTRSESASLDGIANVLKSFIEFYDNFVANEGNAPNVSKR